jgi:hypothetical protein
MISVRMRFSLAGAAALLLLGGCTVQREPSSPPKPKPFVIGMGDIMLLNQLHHDKLWFAGTAGNWPLAQYEAGELRGGFERVRQYHPTFKKKPTAPAIDEFITNPLAELDRAIADRSAVEFTTAYDDVTEGCNGCHSDLGYDFNRMRRPLAPPFTDQDFSLASKSG